MLFVMIERFKNGDPKPVYERLEQRGRLMPRGLTYIDSWTSEDLTHCYQVVLCEDETLIRTWTEAWKDIIDFEIVPVMSSNEAKSKVL